MLIDNQVEQIRSPLSVFKRKLLDLLVSRRAGGGSYD
jgi:hypothetical protein